jgi:hypothetical protein
MHRGRPSAALDAKRTVLGLQQANVPSCMVVVAAVALVAEIFGRPDLEIKRVSLDNITVDVSSTFSTNTSVVSRS